MTCTPNEKNVNECRNKTGKWMYDILKIIFMFSILKEKKFTIYIYICVYVCVCTNNIYIFFASKINFLDERRYVVSFVIFAGSLKISGLTSYFLPRKTQLVYIIPWSPRHNCTGTGFYKSRHQVVHRLYMSWSCSPSQ